VRRPRGDRGPRHRPGIAADELERATDRFWRSPSRSNVEGSGLGLAIAARTVELAGGSLRLESPEGGGLRVVARLPTGRSS
jgi:signal transduction histidine kinase